MPEAVYPSAEFPYRALEARLTKILQDAFEHKPKL